VRICSCTVRFRDRRGAEHSTVVRAASVYEAACRAWAIFKGSEETEEESFKTEEFIVEMHEEPKTFHVNLEKMLTWLNRQGTIEETARREPSAGRLKRRRLFWSG
jgi:hypothetical protein